MNETLWTSSTVCRSEIIEAMIGDGCIGFLPVYKDKEKADEKSSQGGGKTIKLVR